MFRRFLWWLFAAAIVLAVWRMMPTNSSDGFVDYLYTQAQAFGDWIKHLVAGSPLSDLPKPPKNIIPSSTPTPSA